MANNNSGCGEILAGVVLVIIGGCLIWWVVSDKQAQDTDTLTTTVVCAGHGQAEQVIGWQAGGELILCADGEIRFEPTKESKSE